MDVTLLYSADCPNWKVADGHLAEVARELPDVTITRRLISTPEDAARVGFQGSPSILVDGVDIFAEHDDDPGAPVGLSCRVYQTPEGPAGSPTLGQLRAVMTVADRETPVGVIGLGAAMGICCAFSILVPVGVAGIVAGLSVGHWALIAAAVAVTTIGLRRRSRQRDRCEVPAELPSSPSADQHARLPSPATRHSTGPTAR